MGDTLVWRVLNASPAVHPMYLHGFYFRVDGFDGPQALPPSKTAGGRMAVAEHMLPFTTMRMTWAPTRAGNWLFHCHYQPHARPHRPLGPILTADGGSMGHADHAVHRMGGSVMGIRVGPGSARAVHRPVQARRRLRLVAVRDSGLPDALPSMRFVLEERGRRRAAGPGFSPTIELRRGEPVAITVVNRLAELLAVHWHGIELERYFDGVAGFSRTHGRRSPLTAPRDSFEARFTPPRCLAYRGRSLEAETRSRCAFAS